MFVVAYTKNDRQVYHSFVYSVDFAKLTKRQINLRQILSALHLKICLLWSKFVK